MADLRFIFSPMGGGKSTALLQAAHNIRECGMSPLILVPEIASDIGQVKSRIGISSLGASFSPTENLSTLFTDLIVAAQKIQSDCSCACVLVDEAQFLTADQVRQLARLVDVHSVPVRCYGLRTDFRGDLFEGSMALAALSDSIVELDAICLCARKGCGKKATMHLKVVDGRATLDGPQVDPAAVYESVCRRHWREALR